jgi:hypothetical protein
MMIWADHFPMGQWLAAHIIRRYQALGRSTAHSISSTRESAAVDLLGPARLGEGEMRCFIHQRQTCYRLNPARRSQA